MVDKLIRGKIIEIMVVLVLVILSIPVWKAFDEKISAANLTTLDDYNVNFNVYNTNYLDRIIVSNDYYISKNYKIMLVVNKSIDEENSNIIINDIEYNITDFYKEKKRNNYIYTLVDNYISGDIDYYNIKPNIIGKKNNYSYVFEEKTIF